VNENDNNKNRKYEALNERISETYAKSSRATNKSALSDPYVKAIRWASDRIKQEGVVAFVTNSGFLEALAADGMRMHLSRDFDEVYIVALGATFARIRNFRVQHTTSSESKSEFRSTFLSGTTLPRKIDNAASATRRQTSSGRGHASTLGSTDYGPLPESNGQ